MILQAGHRAGKCIIVAIDAVLLCVHGCYRHNRIALHFFPQSLADVCVVRDHFCNNIRGTGKSVFQCFHAFVRVNVISGHILRISTILFKNLQSQRFQTLFFGNCSAGTALLLVGTVMVLHFCQCCRIFNLKP